MGIGMTPSRGEKTILTDSRVLYFDVLNVIACISVLFLHCNMMVHSWNPGRNWIVALAIETLFFFAVPIFFMLTGATLMRYRERYDTSTFFRKRMIRIVIPFLMWELIASLKANCSIRNGCELSALNPLRFVEGILNNTIESTYWFFFPLFAIYLAIPIISLLKDQQKTLIYAATVAFILQYCMPVIMRAIGDSWNMDLMMPALGGFLFYPVLGYLLSTLYIPKKYRIILYLSAILTLAVKFGYTWYFSSLVQSVDRTFFDYRTFTAALPAAALFVWFKNADLGCLDKYQKSLIKISSCSFGIYLMHNLVLFGVLSVLAIEPTSILLRTVGPFILYVFCLCVVLVLKEIPIVRKIVP